MVVGKVVKEVLEVRKGVVPELPGDGVCDPNSCLPTSAPLIFFTIKTYIV